MTLIHIIVLSKSSNYGTNTQISRVNVTHQSTLAKLYNTCINTEQHLSLIEVFTQFVLTDCNEAHKKRSKGELL